MEIVIPAHAGKAELTVKRSRFIGAVMPVSDENEALRFIEQVRKENRDATHHVFAYTAGGISRFSDDGEPQGTAGAPVMNVIEKQGVDRCALVVTRYFGGVLLGAGGLVRAYTETAAAALLAAGRSVLVPWRCFEICCAYPLVGLLEREIAQQGGVTEKTDFGEKAVFQFRIPSGQAALFSARLSERSGGQISVRDCGEIFAAKTAESGQISGK